MKSLKNGISNSDFEISNISSHGFWNLFNSRFDGKKFGLIFQILSRPRRVR